MEIVDRQQRRALAFVRTAQSGGHRPAGEDVAAWLERPSPGGSPARGAGRDGRGRAWFGPSGQPEDGRAAGWRGGAGDDAVPPHAHVEHLLRLRWLEVDGRGGLGLTPLGAALLRTTGDAPAAVVLDESTADGPAGPALLVDPELRVDQLEPLRTRAGVTRILVGRELPDPELAALAAVVRTSEVPLELRVALAGVLRDRLVVGESAVRVVGTAVGERGRRHGAALADVPSLAADAVRREAEQWWAGAETVAVWPPGSDGPVAPRRAAAPPRPVPAEPPLPPPDPAPRAAEPQVPADGPDGQRHGGGLDQPGVEHLGLESTGRRRREHSLPFDPLTAP